MRSDRRKNRRRKSPEQGENGISIKNTLYIAGTILALGIIAFIITVMVYNNSIEKIYDDLESQEIAKTEEIVETNYENILEEASATIGKTVDEAIIETEETSIENEDVKETSVVEETNEIEENTEEANNEESAESEETETGETETETEEKELSFSMPVEGEVQREYAKDKLVYSETLKEWVTHTGIDIKADKTTVVKAAEEGTVTSIKNDPRYGITVIIEHSGGYETRYANLLTAEFVSVGEEVSKGQTIGTVGDTAAFEILDEPHLHFEILKDGEYQDPTSIIK